MNIALKILLSFLVLYKKYFKNLFIEKDWPLIRQSFLTLLAVCAKFLIDYLAIEVTKSAKSFLYFSKEG